MLNNAEKLWCRTPGISIKGELKFFGQGHNNGTPEPLLVHPI
jgi:hypothetical protein